MKTKQILINVATILAMASLLSAEELRGSQRFHQFTDPQLGSMPVSATDVVANPYVRGMGTQDIRARMTLEDVDCLAEQLEAREPSATCKGRRANPTPVQPYRPAKPSANLRGSQRYHQEDERRLGIPESAPDKGTQTLGVQQPTDTIEIRGQLFEDTRVIHYGEEMIALDNGSSIPKSVVQKTLDALGTLAANAPRTYEELLRQCRGSDHAFTGQNLLILKGLKISDVSGNVNNDTCSIAISTAGGNGPPIREFPQKSSLTK